MNCIITTNLPSGIARFLDNGEIDFSSRGNIPVLAKITNIEKYNGNAGGYTFIYNNDSYWTYYDWLFAEDTHENILLIMEIENKRFIQDELQKKIKEFINKITRPDLPKKEMAE